MLKELFDAIGATAVKAAGPQVQKPPAEPEHVYYLNGNKVHAEPPPRDHEARDLQAVVEFVKREPDKAVIWYSRDSVVCVCQDIDGDRRDRVTLTLTQSRQVQTLLQLEACPKPFNQRELVYLLRTTFAKCLDKTGNLLEVLRAVRFKSAAAGESVVKHGKSSVGKSLEHEITGLDAIPEYVTLHVPIFGNAFPTVFSYVELALEPDAQTESFRLIPLPASIENAIADGERAILGYLTAMLNAGEATVPVYYGTP